MKNSLLILIGIIAFFSSCHHNTMNNKKNNDSIAEQKTTKDYKMYPVDESKNDPTLVDFIKHLNKIIEQRDTSALYSILDSGVIVSYGGGLYGKTAFIENWELDDPKNSNLWKALKRILKLGGTFEKDNDKEMFRIPYANSNKAYEILDPEHDCYFIAVCINPHEPVYQLNDPKSKIIGYLQYDFVTLIDVSNSSGQLVKIKTYNNKMEGFVNNNSLVYCIDGKLDLQKDKTGHWKIISYAPFD